VRNPFEVPELQAHCEVYCIAEQLTELQNRQVCIEKLKNVFSDTILANV